MKNREVEEDKRAQITLFSATLYKWKKGEKEGGKMWEEERKL